MYQATKIQLIFSFLFIIIVRVYISNRLGIVYILFNFILFYSDPNKPEKQESVHGGRVTNRFINLEWPKYDLEDQKYLHIGKRFFVWSQERRWFKIVLVKISLFQQSIIFE